MTGTKKWLHAILEGRRHWQSALYSLWLLSQDGQKSELSLIDVAAAQVTDGFTLAGHRGSVVVIQFVLLGLANEFAGQVKEKFLNIVGLFGWGLQIEHALSLSEVFRPLPENLSLLCQIYLITWKETRQVRMQQVPCGERDGGLTEAGRCECACMCGTDKNRVSVLDFGSRALHWEVASHVC